MIEPEAPTAPRRRRLALSVRALMILVLLVGLPIGWKARRASLQRRAVAAIRAMGGTVRYDWQVPNPRTGIVAKNPPVSWWIRPMIDDEYFQEVVGVDFPIVPWPKHFLTFRPGITPTAEEDKEVRFVARIEPARRANRLGWLDGVDRLESLDMVYASGPLDEEALARLGKLDRLKRLTISNVTTSVTPTLGRMASLENLTIMAKADAFPIPYIGKTGTRPVPFDLAFLGRMPRLRHLSFLQNARVGDEQMMCLGRLTSLESLQLETMKAQSGLAHLAGLKSLRYLAIYSTPELTDSDLAGLAALKSLANLTLSTTPKLTDSGLANLAGLANLEFLNLPQTLLDGSGLRHLESLSKLNHVQFLGRRLDPKAVDRLKAAIPGLTVELR